MKDFPGRCTYVTPSRRAATAALRLRRCLATLHLRHSFALRCNGSAASSSVSRYAATAALRDVSRAATLQRSSARMDSYKRMDRRTVMGDGIKPCRSNCVEATKDTEARTNSY